MPLFIQINLTILNLTYRKNIIFLSNFWETIIICIIKTMKLERVQKLIAQSGIASRREAEQIIIDKKVKVNNKLVMLGDKATFKDQITVDGKLINQQEKVYYLMNKPRKTLSSLKKQDDRQLIIDLIKEPHYIFPVGRLDYNTTGTVLLTNDGELAFRLMHPRYEVMRVYEAKLSRMLTNQELKQLNDAKLLIDDKTSWKKIIYSHEKTYIVKLKQGINHHVKKIFATVNVTVENLSRLEFAGLSHLGQLKHGEYRALKIYEIKKLKQLVHLK